MLFMNDCVWPPTLKKEVVQILDSLIISFFKKYEEITSHNMFNLMLDPRFKTFYIMCSLIGHEQGKAIVEEYDKKNCFLCFSNVIIICIHWLNMKGVLLIKRLKRKIIWISLKWQLAQMSQQQNWPIDSVIKWMLKTSSGHCSDGKNMRACFLQFALQMLRIPRSQIET